MKTELKFDLAVNYSSKSQKARIVTESWVSLNLYCPICGSTKLSTWPNNNKVSDFYCEQCNENFQLKSSSKSFGKVIPGAEYYTLIKMLENDSQPNLLLMWYKEEQSVIESLTLIPRIFFNSKIVEKRKPLSETARRAGWTGCNIRLDLIPNEGKIFIIRDETPVSKDLVHRQVRKIFRLFSANNDVRHWYIEVLKILNQMPRRFTTSDLYKYENYLKQIFPYNNNIKAKLRQLLQQLRDDGFIYFRGDGLYEKA